MTTAWTVGYVIGEIPSNILLTKIRPSIWIPACEVGHFTYPLVHSRSRIPDPSQIFNYWQD